MALIALTTSRHSRRRRRAGLWSRWSAAPIAALITTQALTLLLYALEPSPAPWSGGILERLWVHDHATLVIAFAAMLGFGVFASAFIWVFQRRLRLVMVSTWVLFALFVGMTAGDKFASVARVLWETRLASWVGM
ncbi:MAG: hypothetical protein ACF8PN_05270 [Phycisphaerales bacterium]